jgi:hypothetical protein
MYMLLYVCARSRASERRRLPGEPTPRTRRWCGGRRATAEGRALVPPTVRCAVLVRGARRRRPPGERRRRRRGPDRIFIVVLPAAPDGRPSGRREFVKAPSLGLAGEAGTRREVRRPGASPRRRPPGAALWPAAAGPFGLRELVPCGTAAGVVIDVRRVCVCHTRLGVVCAVCRSETGRNAEERRPRARTSPASVARRSRPSQRRRHRGRDP